jgi:hypothetical protein
MAAENNYQGVVELIATIEKQPRNVAITTINPNEILSKQVTKITYAQKEVESLVATIDRLVPYNPLTQGTETKAPVPSEKKAQKSGGLFGKKAAKQQPAAQQAEVQASLQSSPQAPVPQPVMQQPIPPRPPEQALDSEVRRTANEMKTQMQEHEYKHEEIKNAQIKAEENLVLPNLSVPDQIADLEKINQGLDADIFSASQLQVVREEVNGLAERAKKSAEPAEGTQKDLISLRDQRLAMVKARLGLK